MKILHTADWHLGHRHLDEDRHEEFNHFLSWTLKTIQEKNVEVLIIAGDIFDTAMPSAPTEKQYNDFLHQIIDTDCKHIVIVGGNHDSPQRLMVASSLLKRFDIHIVGSIGMELNDLIIPVKKSTITHEELAICAVPFIRNSDILQAVSGENFDDLEKRYAAGLQRHYQNIADMVESKGFLNQIPIIATGHLFVMGQSASDSERTIHVGKLGSIPADAFPEVFDYIALGHLHRPQIVAKNNKIRYSGSPLAFSFSESDQRKSMQLLEVKDGKLIIDEIIEVPEWRKLIRLKGTKDEVIENLRCLNAETQETSWVEVLIESESHHPNLSHDIRSIVKESQNIKVLKVTLEKSHENFNTNTISRNTDLKALQPQEVFDILLEEKKVNPEDKELLKSTFQELLDEYFA